MNKLIVFVLVFFLQEVLSECPFARIRNPGYMCWDEVGSEAEMPVDYIIEKIHENDDAAMTEANCKIAKVECNANSPYRSYSGYCNNLVDPTKAIAFSTFPRLIANAYEDGVGKPREFSSSNSGKALPNPRRVSVEVNWLLESVKAGASKDHNHFLAIFGQFLGHDCTYTALVPGIEECRECDSNHPECMPIQHLYQDPDFNPQVCGSGCSEFTRSANGNTDTTPGAIREQLNQVSSYLDLSPVYGTDTKTAQMLRDSTNEKGQLLTKDDGTYLPQVENGPQCSPMSPEPCFLAGDNRNPENAGLTAVHLMFVKEHNRIAQYFYEKTEWSGEEIYQKTRQIMIALYQHIIYDELLPNLLSDSLLTQYGLKEEDGGNYFTGYDSSVDATPVNAFSTAGWRFGHSTVLYRTMYKNANGDNIPIEMSENWYNVSKLLDDPLAPMGVLANLFNHKMQRRDRHFVFVMHKRVLGVRKFGFGQLTPPFDVNTLNIQRGRDHGLPSYNEYRKYYGLSTLLNFEQLQSEGIINSTTDPDLLGALKKVYENVDDIDLFTGTTFEQQPPDGQTTGLLGEVAAHIIADQFSKLKKGDRYFYSNPAGTNPGYFSPAQLEEIRKQKLAGIACNHINMDLFADTWIGKENSFQESTTQYTCSDIQDFDLSVFLYSASNVDVQYYKDSNEDSVVSSTDACYAKCRQTTNCKFWEYNESNNVCFVWKELTEGDTTLENNPDITIIGGSLSDSAKPIAEPIVLPEANWTMYVIDKPKCGLEKIGGTDEGVKFL